jgi:hypothetical protein
MHLHSQPHHSAVTSAVVHEGSTPPITITEILLETAILGLAIAHGHQSRRLWAPFYMSPESLMLSVTGLLAFTLYAPLIYFVLYGTRRHALSAALPGVIAVTILWVTLIPVFTAVARTSSQSWLVAKAGIIGSAIIIKIRCRVTLFRAIVPALYAGSMIGTFVTGCYEVTIRE